jgi:hypothetical protein
VAVLARPADAPAVELADAIRPFLAKKLRQRFVAQAAAGRDRVGEMMLRVVGRLFAERDRDRHLRHHGGAAAADQAAIGEQHAGTAARRLDRRIHAGGAGANHQRVGVDGHGLCGHRGVLTPFASLCDPNQKSDRIAPSIATAFSDRGVS